MLPQLKDFNWYIDMKVIPGANGQHMQQPSCVLNLDVYTYICLKEKKINMIFLFPIDH